MGKFTGKPGGLVGYHAGPKWVFFIDVTKNHLTSTVINLTSITTLLASCSHQLLMTNLTSIIVFGEWMYTSPYSLIPKWVNGCDVGEPQPPFSTVECSAGLGIHVLMDLVHAHASSNTLDGIAQMDGTDHCCAPENRWNRVSSWSGVVVSTRCHGAGWVELQPDISNDFVWFLRQGSGYYIIMLTPD